VLPSFLVIAPRTTPDFIGFKSSARSWMLATNNTAAILPSNIAHFIRDLLAAKRGG
jgi:hypothetical protein